MIRWKQITGSDKYSISTTGDIRKNKSASIVKAHPQSKGYLQVSLYEKGRQTIRLVHRLVAIHFIANPLSLPQVNHKNGIKTDNRVENLEWCTNQHNQTHAWKNGLMSSIPKKGESHWKSKLSKEDIINIRQSNMSPLLLAKQYSMSRSHISAIRNGRNWKHIS